jgi:TRAP-type C4-dicarboxylate transport system permease small subunit
MGQILGIFKAIKRFIDVSLNILVIALLALLLIIVTTQILARYIFNHPLSWSEELARYIFIWIVFLGVAIAFRNNRHLRMELLSLIIPNVFRRIIAILVFWITNAFLVLLLIESKFIISITFSQSSPTLNLPMGFIYLSFVVSIGFMLVEQIYRIFDYLQKGRL